MKDAMPQKKYSPAQQQAFGSFDKVISVSAGAGSGKTSVLVERFVRAAVEKGIAPSRILAITFTDKAAGEMKSRLVKACRERGLHEFRRDIENAYVSTIHSFCARVLKENPIESGLDPDFRVLSESEAEILAGRVLDALFDERAGNARWMEIVYEIGEAAARESLRGLYERYRASGGDESLFRVSGTASEKDRKKEMVAAARAFQALFDAEKRRLSSYDFDDLLFLAYKLLSSPAPAAAAVRERYQKRFSLVLVDEYQDVSPLQDALVHLLKHGSNLFIVGDIQQSIYGFRHAEPAVFRKRISDHRSDALARNIVLAENYRSRSEILAFVNRFFKAVFRQEDFSALDAKKEFARNSGAAVELLCQVNDKKDEDAANAAQTRVREARCIAAWIDSLVRSGMTVTTESGQRPVGYGDIAVLFRSTTSSRLYEKELADRKIGYTVVKGNGFYEKPEIADLVGLLSVIEDPENDIALAGVLRSPLVGVSDDALYWLSRHAKARSKQEPLVRGMDAFAVIPELSAADREKIVRFRALVQGLREQKGRLRLSGVLERALAESVYEAKLLARANGRQRVANVRKFLDIAAGFEANGVVGIEDFVRFIGKLSERERLEPEAKLAAAADAVTLSSIHAVKGLEFPVVIVADMGARARNMSRGAFLAMPGVGLGQKIKKPGEDKAEPDETYERIARTLSEREEEEGWRLLYVAMTRAKERLLLSGSLNLRKKDGGFDAGASWMGRICENIGFDAKRAHPERIDWDGIPIAVVPTEIADGPVTPTPAPDGRAASWPRDFAAELSARLGTKFRGYDETEDHTVTDLMAVLAGETPARDEAEERGSLGADDEERSVPANEFGTLFHRYMEHLAQKRPAALTKAGVFSRITSVLGPADKDRLWKQASGFWRGPWGEAVRRADRVYPELPFIFKTPYGLLKGQIDLVFRTREGQWVVLDYKTHRITKGDLGRTAKLYEWQLGLYALVFRKLYGERPEKGVLYFSHLEEVSEMPIAAAKSAEWERTLERAFKGAVERRA